MTAPVHTLTAFNTAKESENKIHDDAVAQRFGFTGGFVPGTEVYAYLTHAPVAAWGRAWLERGQMSARFDKPVYDGAPVEIFARETPDNGLAITCESGGGTCASASAHLPGETGPCPDPADYPRLALPALEARPPASPQTLSEGAALGTYELRMSEADLRTYLDDIREPLDLYMAERVLPSSIFLRMANWALSCTVRMGPWIHVSSDVAHFATASIDEPLEARPTVSAQFERKGHRFVSLDVGVFGESARPLARITHTAIYEPRQVRTDL